MKRWAIAAALLSLCLDGCEVAAVSAPAEAARIPPTQFLRPARDPQTGTWVAAWVDPENFAGTVSNP